jgi:hypothetical protein
LVWVSGPTGVTILASLLLAGALVAGPLLRTHASARRPVAPAAEPLSAEPPAADGRAEGGSVTWPA